MDYALIEKAQEFRNPLVSKEELESLWELANTSIITGKHHEAFCAVEALLCQAERKNLVAHYLPEPKNGILGKLYPAGQLQSLQDRVESFNYQVKRA